MLYNSGREDVLILTMHGYLPITRTVLRPIDDASKQKLKKLTGRKSVVPMDIMLGIDALPFKITRPMMLQIAHDAINADSYQQLAETYASEKGIKISDDEIRNVTDYIGAMIFAEDQKRALNALSTLERDKKLRKRKRETAGVLYLMMDGAYVLLTPKDGGWKEVKTGLCFNSKDVHYWINKKGEECHRILHRDYVSFIGTSDEFTGYIAALFKRHEGPKNQEVVVIGDGADWITTITSKVCPWATHILDLAHLKGKVGDFAKQTMEECKCSEWTDRVCQMLEDGKWEEVLELPEVLAHKDDKTTNGKVNLYLYISSRQDQIDYPTYKKRGYFVGSGAMESANRYIPQRRLKLPGMRWRKISAQGILSLRTRLKAEKWDEVEKTLMNISFSRI